MAPKPPERPRKARLSWRQQRDSIVFALVATVVSALLAASLWVSGSAIVEKYRLAHQLSQIVNIIGETRTVAANDAHIGATLNEDVLADLERLRGFTPTGGGDNGSLRSVANPWHGDLTAVVSDGPSIRIQTAVTPHICRHLIDLFDEDPQAFGVRRIDVLQPGTQRTPSGWRMVFAQGVQEDPGGGAITAACGEGQMTVVALSFTLR